LASPLRQELVDTLEALGGEASVATLAQQLGKSADGLYYHLKQLVAGGVLDELPAAEEAPAGGRRYRVRSRPGTRLKLQYEPRRKGQAEALGKLIGSLLSIARRDFERALGTPGVAVDGPCRELWASRTKGWVSAAEVVEINALLKRLGELLNLPRSEERDRLLALAFVLAPVPAQAPRRGRVSD
jgi:hypothetical protein